MVYRTRYLSTEPKFSAFFHASSCIKAGSLINLGWSDFFAIFEIGHIAADQVCFYEFIPKYRQNWPSARTRHTCGKVLIFLNYRDLSFFVH